MQYRLWQNRFLTVLYHLTYISSKTCRLTVPRTVVSPINNPPLSLTFLNIFFLQLPFLFLQVGPSILNVFSLKAFKNTYSFAFIFRYLNQLAQSLQDNQFCSYRCTLSREHDCRSKKRFKKKALNKKIVNHLKHHTTSFLQRFHDKVKCFPESSMGYI